MRWALAIGLGLASAAASAETPVLSRGWTFDEQGGAALYKNVCAACHQADGRGAVGAASYPSLAGDPKLASTDYVLTIVLGGLHAMPAIGQGMSDAQVADVVNYARENFADGRDDPATPARAAAARSALKR
jgi:mono/diheme cytochrome c family protein